MFRRRARSLPEEGWSTCRATQGSRCRRRARGSPTTSRARSTLVRRENGPSLPTAELHQRCSSQRLQRSCQGNAYGRTGASLPRTSCQLPGELALVSNSRAVPTAEMAASSPGSGAGSGREATATTCIDDACWAWRWTLVWAETDASCPQVQL